MKENKQRNNNRILANLLIIGILVGIIVMIAVPIIGATIWYKNTVENYQQELESYSLDTYEYLVKSVSLIFREGEGIIDINAKQDDIIIEKFEMQDDGKFICKLFWDNGEEKKYFPNPNITAELSEDLEILHTSTPYASEEEFVKAFKTNIKNDAVEKAYTIFFIFVFGLIMLYYIPYSIKSIRKSYKRNFQQKKWGQCLHFFVGFISKNYFTIYKYDDKIQIVKSKFLVLFYYFQIILIKSTNFI